MPIFSADTIYLSGHVILQSEPGIKLTLQTSFFYQHFIFYRSTLLCFFFFLKKKLINKAVTDDDADDWCGILCTMHQNEWRSVSEEKGKKRVKAQFLVNYFFRFLKKLNRCTKTFEFDVFKKNLPEAHMLGWSCHFLAKGKSIKSKSWHQHVSPWQQ